MLQKIKTLAVLFIATITLVVAQEKGKIAGKIVDGATNEELIGVAVGIKGSSSGASSDIDGHYAISLTPGTYTIVTNYVGYKTKEISDIVVVSGQVVSLDITLDEAVTEMEEVIVTATFKKESVDALLLERKNGISVSDGITADLIKKTPDRNTSDVLKRVSGATIQDNKFAIIRGLNERYNMALVNGTPLPSTESDKKAFSFDLFPANVLDKINVTKTAQADMPADFAGGIIDITTKDIPDQNFFTIGIGASGNSITTGQGFHRSKGGKLDFLGIDDGSRKLPSNIPSVNDYVDFSANKYSTNYGYAPMYAENLKVEAAKQLNNNWGSNFVKSMAPAPQMQLSMGRAGRVLGKESGVIFALNYQSNYKFNNVKIERYTALTDISKVNREQQNSGDGNLYKTNVASGVLLNFSTKLNEYNKLSFKNFFNQAAEDQVFYQDAKDVSGQDPIIYKYYASQFISNRVLSNQLVGEHYLPVSKLKFHWNVGNNKIEREIPDFKRLTYNLSEGSYKATIFANRDVNEQSGSRFWSNTNENIRSASYSVSRDFKKIKNLNIKIGGFNQYRSRSVESRLVGMGFSTFSSAKNKEERDFIKSQSIDQIFTSENMYVGGLGLENFSANQSKAWNYTAASITNAYYAMADIKPFENLRIVGGLRIEAFNQLLRSYDPEKQSDVSLNTTKVDRLPSATIIYSLNSKSNLRANYSQTVNRPEFRELAPFPFYDFVTRYLVHGNPNLKRAYVYNTDLRYEFFPGAGQVFSVTAFYKYFENPIEFHEIGSNSSPDASYDNAKKAINYGVELEWRQNLQALLPSVASKFTEYSTIFSNFTLINTRAFIDTTETNFSGATPIRALQGQSPYLLNAGYNFIHPKHNYSLNLSVNRNGQRIFIVGNAILGRPDVIEKPRTVLDFQVSKTFFEKLECRFTFGDILAQHLIFYQDIDKDGKFKSDKDYIFSDATLGRNYSFSLSYKF